MALAVSVSAVPEQLVISLQHLHHGAPHCLTLLAVMTWGTAVGWWPAACSIEDRSRGQSLLSVIAVFHCRAGRMLFRMLFRMPNQQCHSVEGK